MNKVDAFGVMTSLLLVWLFSIYLLPYKIMMFIYPAIAAWAIGRFIGRVPGMLSKETERDFLNDMFDVADNQNKAMAEMLQCLKIAAVANRSLLARIDELMFEYCPEDMTPDQIANYEAHQQAVNEPLH
jgi:hypothetical protein